MATRLQEYVLAPVADILSQIVMAGADMNDDSIPESISADIPSIVSATELFQKAAVEMRFRPEDTDLKDTMILAMHHVQEGLMNLADAKSKDSRSKLVGGIFVILEAARSALSVYDTFEIRRIVATAELSISMIRTLISCQVMVELEIAAKLVAEALLSLARLSSSRESDIRSDYLRCQLKEAVEVVKSHATLVISASRSYCENPSDSSQQSAKSIATQLTKAIKSILEVVQANPGLNTTMKAAGELWLLMDDIGQRLIGMLRSIHDTDRTQLIDEVKKYSEQALVLLKQAEEISLECSDPYLADRLAKEATALRLIIPEVVKTLQGVAKGTMSEVVLEYKIQEATAAVASVMQAIGDALDAQVVSAIDTIHGLNARMQQAVQEGDSAAFEAAVKELETVKAGLLKNARLKAEQCADPIVRQRLLDALDAVDSLSAATVAAGKAALLNPTSATAQAHFQSVSKMLSETLNSLENVVNESVPLADLITSLQQQTQQLAKEFADCLERGDHKGAALVAHKLNAKVQRLANLLRAEALANAADEKYSSHLNNIALQLEANVGSVFQQAAQLAQHVKNTGKSDPILIKAMHASIQKLNTQTSVAVSAVKGKMSEMDKRVSLAVVGDRSSIAIELEVAEELGPVPEDPIKRAGHAIKQEVSKWDGSENALVTKANTIAEQFSKIADFAKSGDKKGLIQSCRTVSEEAQALAKQAASVAASCSDKRLKQQLEAIAQAIPTMCTQLRILCAVKAGSSSADPETLEQLATCANNLSTAITNTVKASQAASIRSVHAVATVVTAALKWKKKIR